MNLDLFAKYNDLNLGLEYNSLLLQAFLCPLLTGKNLTFSRQWRRDINCLEGDLHFSHMEAPETVLHSLCAGHGLMP